MEYKIISTGSKGNAVVVDGRILIDCGVPFRRLESVYRDLDAVLLTHIHSDHFQPKTLARLAAERPSLRFFACPWLGPDLQNAGVPLRQITITTPDRWYDTGYCFQLFAATGLFNEPVVKFQRCRRKAFSLFV